MNGTESKLLSSSVVLTISKIFNVSNSSMFINKYELIFRKLAHVTEYLVLCLLLYNYVKYFINDKKIYLYITIVSCIYSISDEIHQSFVGGRSSTLIDIMIDMIGVCIALIVIIVYKKYASKRKSD